MLFEDKKGDNVKIAKIKAAGLNCAAYTEQEKVYIWGSGSNGKLGLETSKNFEVPTQVCWEIQKQGSFEDDNE